MDRTFMHIVAIGVILIALGALVVCAFRSTDQALVLALVSIASNCTGALGGVMTAPKLVAYLNKENPHVPNDPVVSAPAVGL